MGEFDATPGAAAHPPNVLNSNELAGAVASAGPKPNGGSIAEPWAQLRCRGPGVAPILEQQLASKPAKDEREHEVLVLGP